LAGLTTKELGLIEDNLRQEHLMVQKYNMYANQVKDPEIKNLCQQLRDLHQSHTDILMKHLNEASKMQ
jgi:rubrerythrin